MGENREGEVAKVLLENAIRKPNTLYDNSKNKKEMKSNMRNYT